MLRASFHTLRRASTLAYVETSAGAPTAALLSLLTAAAALGQPVLAVLAGPGAAAAAATVRTLAPVLKVYVLEDAAYAHQAAEALLPLLAAVAEAGDYSHVVVPALVAGRGVLPRIAAAWDVQPISDITGVVDAATFVRPIYAGNAYATVRLKDAKVLVSVRGLAFAPATAGGEEAPVETVAAAAAPRATEFVSEELVTLERPDLALASVVVSGGRGLRLKEEFLAVLEPLASKLGAAIGALRAAVDAGFCDNSLQVGQTGKVVAPELYIAVGISGAIQHLAGMKDSKVIVAINKDPESPIFGVADVGLVADVFEAVPELTAKV